MNFLQIIKFIKTDWQAFLERMYANHVDELKTLESILVRDKELFHGLQDIYPQENDIFKTFDFFNMDELKVVILGQDPYHGPNQAMGMCFPVPDGVKIPPSLINIYKEIKQEDPSYTIPKTGNLTHWNEQGVLLLNTSLTVRQSKPNCYSKYWRNITDAVIQGISQQTEHCIFLLWGNHAKSKKKYIDTEKHYVFEAKHPSPLSATRGGWFGNGHFRKTNETLQSLGKEKIVW